MAETTGGAALGSPSSPSVADFVGELYGDYGFSEGEPESEDAGAPPAATPEGQEPTVEGSEGAAPSETATAPDATTQATPDNSTPTTSDPDPLDGSTPLIYTVNGQERQFEGITVLKDGGAIIDPDAMEKVTRVMTERDHLFERNQAQHQQHEALNKLIAWTPPGSDKALSGREAVEALHVSRAELIAEVKAFHALLSSPENLRDMLVGRDDGTLAWNPLGVKAFQAELRSTKGDVRTAIAQFFAKQQSAASAPQPFNPQTLAPAATAYAVKALGDAGKGFTAEDKQWAESLAPRFTRLATIEDQRANPQLVAGEPMIEQQFLELVKDRASQRAATAKVVSTATDAAKANAAKIAAAKTGAKPSAAPRITPQKEPERTRDDDFDDAWDQRQAAAARALRAHATTR